MKIISAKVHGVLDYAVVLSFYAAPTLFGFSHTPAVLSYVLATLHLIVTLCTAFPLGLFKLLPFPAHGALEAVVSLSFLAMPWVFGFSGDMNARHFYLTLGIGVLIVIALTDYRGQKA